MRNHEDLPYILVERDSGGSFGAFCLGALVGAGLALLFAPPNRRRDTGGDTGPCPEAPRRRRGAHA